MNGSGSELIRCATSSLPMAVPRTTALHATVASPIKIEACLPASENTSDTVLVPGEDYPLHIRLVPAVRPDEGFAFTDPITVSISWSDTGLSIEPQRRTLRPADLRDGRFSYQINVRAEAACPRVHGELAISYTDGWSERVFVRRFTLRLDGSYHRPAPKFLQKVRVRLDETRDPNTAIVLIERAASGKMRLKGFHAEIEPLSVEGVPQPPYCLADLDQEEPKSKDIYAEVSGFSRTGLEDLLKWLRNVLAAVASRGKELSLVLVEYVETRVPWEMVELDPGQPIGVRAVVVRWLPVMFHGMEVELDLNQVARSGRVLAYLHSGLEEDQELQKCERLSCTSVADLQRFLSAPPPRVALVYLACHGTFARDAQHATQVQSFNNLHDRIRPLDLEAPPALPAPRPVVFINACHSGRLCNDQEGRLIGLPEVFLAKFADAFIGTLGPVEDTVAQGVAARLLCAAQSGSEIPSLLRCLRAEATEQLDWSDPVRRQRYVNTFMYVFYGSPRTTLRLVGATGGGGDE